MLCTNIADKLGSNTAAKKYAKPCFYGLIWYGWSEYGDDNEQAGIYQRRHKKGRVVIARLKFYIPFNKQSGPQQANRQKFADAVLAWQNLTEEQKGEYNKRAKRLNMSGYNLYIRDYLSSH